MYILYFIYNYPGIVYLIVLTNNLFVIKGFVSGCRNVFRVLFTTCNTV